MPKNIKKSSKLKRIRTNKQKKLSALFVFAFLILVFLLLVNFADIFSGIITHKGSMFSVNKIETASFSVYGVSIKDFNNSEDALVYSKTVVAEGGAGFIYKSGEHFVLGNAYQSLNEAMEIKQNLINLGYNARIVNIKVEALSRVYRGNNLSLLTTAINWFRNCYNLLYEEGLNFDKNLSTQNQVNGKIAQLLTNLSSLTSKVSLLKQSSDQTIKQVLVPSLNNCKTMLEDLLYFNTSSPLEYSAKIKQTSILVVLENRQVIKDLLED